MFKLIERIEEILFAILIIVSLFGTIVIPMAFAVYMIVIAHMF